MAWVVHCEWLWAWMKDNAGSELGDARGEQRRSARTNAWEWPLPWMGDVGGIDLSTLWYKC